MNYSYEFDDSHIFGNRYLLEDFSNLRLNKLPLDNIEYKKGQIEHLDISNNRIADLPNDMSYFKNLKILSIQDNPLVNLPPGLLTIPSLLVINIDQRVVDFLFVKPIRNLLHKRRIMLNVKCEDGTWIENYDNVILRSLWKTPTIIYDSLYNKDVVLLSNSGLNYFPIGMIDCTKVLTLDLSYNKISGFPCDMSNFIKLRAVYIQGNPLNDFPFGVSTIPNLKQLSIDKDAFDLLSPDSEIRKTLKQKGVKANVMCKDGVWIEDYNG